MKLIIGLGNPGNEYSNTHHNIGFMALEKIDKIKGLTFAKNLKYNAEIAEYNYKSDKVLLVKPLTYMNLSGNSVGKLARFFKVNSEDILVIHDDLDLPLAKLRIRRNGSSGGHNGIKSIIECLGTSEFPRVRIGIDNPKKNQEHGVIDYVLSKFSEEDLKLLDPVLDLMPNLVDDFIEHGIDYVMNHYNKR